MGYVYISMRRTDIPAGAIQVLDLQPNSSQRNTSIDPPGQTKYVIRLQNDTLAALNANRTVAAYQGVAAYLIDHVINGVGDRTITVAQANTAALAMSSGVAMRPIGLRSMAPLNISGMLVSTMFQTPPLKYTVPGETTLVRMWRPAY